MAAKESIEYRRIWDKLSDRALIPIAKAASHELVACVGCLAPDRQLSEIGEFDDGRDDV